MEPKRRMLVLVYIGGLMTKGISKWRGSSEIDNSSAHTDHCHCRNLSEPLEGKPTNQRAEIQVYPVKQFFRHYS
jgi:hypothetical protein